MKLNDEAAFVPWSCIVPDKHKFTTPTPYSQNIHKPHVHEVIT